MLFEVSIPFAIAFCYILASHWLADFVWQPHWVASNKSKSFPILLLHGVMYTTFMLTLGIIAVAGFTIAGFALPTLPIVSYYVWNGVIHTATDLWTSKLSGRYWRLQKVHKFFEVIGLDQLIHVLTLFITLVVLL